VKLDNGPVLENINDIVLLDIFNLDLGSFGL